MLRHSQMKKLSTIAFTAGYHPDSSSRSEADGFKKVVDLTQPHYIPACILF
jgi:hypothetical protein